MQTQTENGMYLIKKSISVQEIEARGDIDRGGERKLSHGAVLWVSSTYLTEWHIQTQHLLRAACFAIRTIIYIHSFEFKIDRYYVDMSEGYSIERFFNRNSDQTLLP